MLGRQQEPSRLREALKDLVCVAAAVAALVTLGYLVSGFVAALVQDGTSEAMSKGLGLEPPVPVRLFRSVQAEAPAAFRLGLLAGLLHVPLRLARRRRSFLGASFAWDVLLSPLLTAAAIFGAVALWTWRGSAGQFRDPVAHGVWGAAWAWAMLAAAGLGIWSLKRSRALRLTGLAVLALVSLTVAGAELWGRRSLAAFDERCDAEAAAEQERRAAAQRPILRGEPLEEDAAPRYRKLFDSWRQMSPRDTAVSSLRQAGDADPFAPIPPDLLAVLEDQRAALAELRVATRSRRSLLGVDFDPTSAFSASVLPLRGLASALVVEGHERAQSGDPRGAAERYLDVVRFGGDVGVGSMLGALIGGSIEESGLVALGRLVLSGRLEPTLFGSIERERAALEAHRVSFADGLRCSRLFWGHLERTIRVAPMHAGLDEPLILPAIIPYRAFAAHAVSSAEPLHRRLEEALRRGERAAWEAAGRDADAIAGSSLNFMLRNLMGYGRSFDGQSSPFGLRLFLSSLRPLTWHRLAQAALLVQGSRGGGRLAAEPQLPDDPFGNGTPLRSSKSGRGHRLWSVGYDAKDDGGVAEKETDLVLSSRSPQ